MTDIVDKILILLLVLMLPLSIFLTSHYKDKLEGEDLEEVKMQKIDKAIDQIKTTVASEKKPPVTPITIESVTYASTSGELKVKGKAPNNNISVMVSATVTPPATSAKTASDSAETVGSSEEAVLGETVEVLAVKPDTEGEFTFVKKLDPEDVGVIELRLEQLESEVTIQYNLQEEDQTYTIFSSE
ncbi:MAG: hypothetical protein ACOX6V_02615 [Patescibacteria group bacterium]|jgi:hypothetical protein